MLLSVQFLFILKYFLCVHFPWNFCFLEKNLAYCNYYWFCVSFVLAYSKLLLIIKFGMNLMICWQFEILICIIIAVKLNLLSDDIHVKFFSQMTFTILRNITTYSLDTKALLLFGEIIINQVLMNVNIYSFHLNYFVPAISKFSPKSFACTLPLYWGSIAQIYIWFIIKLECYIW